MTVTLGAASGVPPGTVGFAAISPVTSQIALTGPAGSGEYGSSALVLSNGNYVVADPAWSNGTLADVGAVRLYDGATVRRER